ncbi:MAG TPA: hypothetical protein VF733_04855 [Candidatus Saccharimonadales bacterium]
MTVEGFSDSLDPRSGLYLPVEGLPIPTELSLPCGRLACEPFAADCIQDPTLTPNQARTNCSLLIANTVLHREVEELRARLEDRNREVRILRSLVDELSIDSELGIMTYSTIKVMLRRMEEQGFLEEMREKGYLIELLVLDLDKMKSHNTLGTWKGGDAALREIAGKLRTQHFKRKTDLLVSDGIQQGREQGLLEKEQEARVAIERGEGFQGLGRFARGDEILGISVIPPRRGKGDRRNPLLSHHQRCRQIEQTLSDLSVQYGYGLRQSPEDVFDDPEDRIEFTIDESKIVTAGVSVKFVLALAEMPATVRDFETIFNQAGGLVGNMKQEKTGRLKTRGHSLYLVRDDRS